MLTIVDGSDIIRKDVLSILDIKKSLLSMFTFAMVGLAFTFDGVATTVTTSIMHDVGLWHARFGHANYNNLLYLKKQNMMHCAPPPGKMQKNVFKRMGLLELKKNCSLFTMTCVVL